MWLPGRHGSRFSVRSKSARSRIQSSSKRRPKLLYDHEILEESIESLIGVGGHPHFVGTGEWVAPSNPPKPCEGLAATLDTASGWYGRDPQVSSHTDGKSSVLGPCPTIARSRIFKPFWHMLLWPDSRAALRVCSKSPMLWSVSVVACTETDPGTSPRSADGASTESC